MQVEAAAREYGREVEFPVEEALLFANVPAHLKPRVALDHLLDRFRTGEVQVEFLGVVQVVPAGSARQVGPAAVLLACLRFPAEQLLTCIDPLVQGGRWRRRSS